MIAICIASGMHISARHQRATARARVRQRLFGWTALASRRGLRRHDGLG